MKVSGVEKRVCGTEVLREWAKGAPLNTDDVPIIEFSAAASHQSGLPPSVHRVLEAVAQLRAAEQRRAVRPTQAAEAG